MGASASLKIHSETIQFNVYKEIMNVYDNEIHPKILSGDMEEIEAYRILKLKFESLSHQKALEQISPSLRQWVDQLRQHESLHIPQKPSSPSSRMSYDTSTFCIGDIVKAKVECLYFEGSIVDIIDEHTVLVDFGDDIETVQRKDCYLVRRNEDIKVGDKLEVKPPGQHLYYHGEVKSLNSDGTVLVHMQDDNYSYDKDNNSDKDNDEKRNKGGVDVNVEIKNVRKLQVTNRNLSLLPIFKMKPVSQSIASPTISISVRSDESNLSLIEETYEKHEENEIMW